MWAIAGLEMKRELKVVKRVDFDPVTHVPEG